MYIFQIFFSLIFLIKIALLKPKSCDENKCRNCLILKEEKFNDCKCSKWTEDIFKHECHLMECVVCEAEDRVFVGNCYCNKCEYAKSAKEEEKGNDNKIKIITGIVCPCVVIIFAVLLIIYLRYYKCKKRERIRAVFHPNNENIDIRNINNNDNNVNIYNVQRNHHMDNNINSKDKIMDYKIALFDIFTKEEYLGPKQCKKEYEKYNIECTICIEKFKDGIDMVSITPCFHLFHNKCLRDYFQKNKNAKCPNCNFDIINYFNKKENNI